MKKPCSEMFCLRNQDITDAKAFFYLFFMSNSGYLISFMSVTIAKVGVESSSLFSRSKFEKALVERLGLFLWLNIFKFNMSHAD